MHFSKPHFPVLKPVFPLNCVSKVKKRRGENSEKRAGERIRWWQMRHECKWREKTSRREEGENGTDRRGMGWEMGGSEGTGLEEWAFWAWNIGLKAWEWGLNFYNFFSVLNENFWIIEIKFCKIEKKKFFLIFGN